MSRVGRVFSPFERVSIACEFRLIIVAQTSLRPERVRVVVSALRPRRAQLRMFSYTL